MKQILLVAQREFLSQVKNKTFVIMTILTPLLIILFAAIVGWMMVLGDSQRSVAVVDESGLFHTALTPSSNELFFFYSEKDKNALRDSLQESKSIDALLIIPKADSNFVSIEKNTELITKTNLGPLFRNNLENKMNKHLESLKLENHGISENTLNSSKSNVSFKFLNLKDGSQDSNEGIKVFFAIALTYIIFTFIMMYGVRVMRSVVEEKNNRVVEIIISSVKPFNLMMGKMLGTTFVAITQFLIWITMTIVLMIGLGGFVSSKMDSVVSKEIQEQSLQQMTDINPEWIEVSNSVFSTFMSMNIPLITITFLLFFFFGYLFYSSIFAAIGSAVDKDTDTQQFTLYPIIPLMLAMYGSMTALNNPESPVVFWMSIIPLTSPVSMVTRIPLGVEWWEIALSLFLLIISTWIMIIIASKIYRVGILMYGKKASFKEIWRWLKQTQ